MMMSPLPARPLRLMCTAFTVIDGEVGELFTICSLSTIFTPATSTVVFGAGFIASAAWSSGSADAAPSSVVDPVEPEPLVVHVLLIAVAVSAPERAFTVATEALLVEEPVAPVVPVDETCRRPVDRMFGTVTVRREFETFPPLEGNVTTGTGSDVTLTSPRGVTSTDSPNALPLTEDTAAIEVPERLMATKAATATTIVAARRVRTEECGIAIRPPPVSR
jgi:hypothetical protein